MTIDQYLDNINRRYKQGNATEHTFRGDLQQLIESICSDIAATNEPKRQKCGAPDYILTKRDIPVGYIEAKDIGDKDLEGTKKTGNKEQFDRYKASLNNLIFTDYLDFHFYRDGEFVTKIAIAELATPSFGHPSRGGEFQGHSDESRSGSIESKLVSSTKSIKPEKFPSSGGVSAGRGGQIVPLPQNFSRFTNLIKSFCTHTGQTIKSPKKLAQMMAGKARLLSDVIERALTSDEANQENSTLIDQMTAFKQILIHDITPKGFADVYAQTIAYGMFAARLHDPTIQTFSRQEAAELIPKSNPFLRKLFGYIAGPDLDDRIKWIVDNLVEIFLASNVLELLRNYGSQTKTEDPIIHFYETFLSEYDPALRKARGVWYTPQPVVNFIVRAVDDILKTEFDLPRGLADNSKTKVKVLAEESEKENKDVVEFIEKEVHKVQILDPATGTGTFLAEVVKHIYKSFSGQEGIWSNYVETHLLPRVNGFELLMASYAMAHLQLDLLLTETGYKRKTTASDQRLRVYLTNSLEESHPYTKSLFAGWLSTEANEANHIKRNTPVMCVIGNPPYSVSSSNKGEWIESLTADYKKDMNERNIQPLSDDYIKFIRFGQYFVDKNGTGILAYISNNSFIDGIIHRQMRKNLLESFDKIYILDLHGNAKKKEVCPDGTPDQNVFDIMQGVSINIFVKTDRKKKNELGQVFHFDLQGKRDEKYDFLNEHSLSKVKWNKLEANSPNFFFVKKDFSEFVKYDNGFKIDEIFALNASGITTERDNITIHLDESTLKQIIQDFQNKDPEEIRKKYQEKPDGRDWKMTTAKQDVLRQTGKICSINYRPFDVRKTYFTGKSKGFMSYPRNEVMKHLLKPNYTLIFERQATIGNFTNIFIGNSIVESHILGTMFSKGISAPLYLYPDSTAQQSMEQTAERKPNLNSEIANQIAKGMKCKYEPATASITASYRDTEGTSITPIDILDYIYAVLHSPAYREKYKEFLKIDFPRVPYPKKAKTFWKLVKLGGEIRQLHLLESPTVENYITQYPMHGDNKVTKVRFQPPTLSETQIPKNSPPLEGCPQGGVAGRVYINDTQYFANVPETAWSFYIGGYQPAQKWLKDRKDRTLEFDDILHYQKMIVALSETDRLMKEIDEIEIE